MLHYSLGSKQTLYNDEGFVSRLLQHGANPLFNFRTVPLPPWLRMGRSRNRVLRQLRVMLLPPWFFNVTCQLWWHLDVHQVCGPFHEQWAQLRDVLGMLPIKFSLSPLAMPFQFAPRDAALTPCGYEQGIQEELQLHERGAWREESLGLSILSLIPTVFSAIDLFSALQRCGVHVLRGRGPQPFFSLEASNSAFKPSARLPDSWSRRWRLG